MRDKIVNALPMSVRLWVRKNKFTVSLLVNYWYDMRAFYRFSFETNRVKTKRHDEGNLIFYYHKIEKGLSLPKPRVGFAKQHVLYLFDELEAYRQKYGWDNVSKVTLNTLDSYVEFNRAHDFEMPEMTGRLQALKNTLSKEVNETTGGGVREITRDDLEKSKINFKEFVFSRYSIRNFKPGEVSIELIQEAISIAQKTPSVCNRQSAKVYVFCGDEIKKNVLKYQNGNAGFGGTADKILIVSMDMRDFRGVIERNQYFIDGGMYAMSLIYALHSLGVGTCPLNLSITHDIETGLKKTAQIPDSEKLIMMIAVGHVPDNLKVAYSHRREASEVMKVIR
ncbi:nitroreductase family protein [Paenibacillus methanolicus]|uniref:Nitroreductase n=1 Tax=Paenibacillus methanolicus TaxID=582686 RepID=A0A5S5BPS9_9BACL|nr:nitroreductase family protein [Paenibacillus methanolicus]TYP69129.1 nitroreductase [Paenibacillus methanolicus]